MMKVVLFLSIPNQAHVSDKISHLAEIYFKVAARKKTMEL